MTKPALPYLLPSIILYCIVLSTHGYIYGGNDQMDFMPYAMHIRDSSFFAHDFYVSCISQKFNERYLLSHFIALFPFSSWKLLFYCLHALSSIVLIFGLYTWVAKFITIEWMVWLAIIATLVLTYNINLGGNELYYNMVCGSLISKSLGIWALWYAYNSKWLKSGVMAIVATYFHPIAGFQILILSALLLNNKTLFKYLVFTFVLVLPYVFLLVKDLNSDLNSALFSEIMLLRNPHHFFPVHFGLRNYILVLPLFLIGTYLWRSTEIKIFRLCCFILAGCLVYIFILALLPKLAIQTQWFKATIWLKFFSILSIIRFVSGWLNRPTHKIIFISLSLLFASIRSLQILAPMASNSIFGSNHNISHAKSIKNESKPDDLYIVSPSFTEFKFYSQLCTYVDWKAIPHNGPCLVEWYRRIKLAFGLDASNIAGLKNVNEIANNYLLNLSADQKIKLKSEGITHIVVLDPIGSGIILIKL